MLFAILLVTILQPLRAETLYDIILEDIVVTYNKEYLTEPDFYVDDSNALTANFSIIKQFPVGTEGRFKIIGATMGEYVIDIGIDVTMDLCDALDNSIFIGPIFKAVGFDADNCPPDVGVYGFEDYQLSMEQLPKVFIPNNYKNIIELFYEDQTLLTLYIFTRIT